MADLEELAAKQEITEVCFRYGIALDNRDWKTLSTCFTEDAQAFYLSMPACHSYAEIEERVRTALEPLDATQHLIANVTAEVNGDEATCICYLQAQHVKTGTSGGDNFTIAGKYLDKFVRTDGGWRIKDRRLEAMWTDGNAAVVGG